MAKAIGLALLLIGAGYFGPWAAHPTAGLVLSADDLAEWVKFLPIYQAGDSGLIRELFFISIWLLPIGLGLLARSVTSWTIKLALLALAVLLVFTPLPKYPELLTAYRAPEFAPTFWITFGSLVTAIGLGLIGRRTHDRAAAMLWILMGLAVALIAPLHFVKVLPDIERLYPVSIGWGLIATVLGGLSLSALGAWRFVTTKKSLTLTSALIGLLVLAAMVMTRPTGSAIAAEPAPPPPALALTSPPVVIFTNPSIGARGVPTYTLVSVTFNQDMNSTTINSSTFFVSQGAVPMVGFIDYITISKVAVFYPGASLAPSTTYTATITTGVQNQSGQPLETDVVWTFTTAHDTSPVGDGMYIFWGDLHNHSSYSDGQGTPVDAYATARANGLDFFALTDHSSLLTEAEWQDVLSQANAATINGQFVGLRGFEFTHPNGHINVFDTDTYVSESDSNYDTFEEFYTWLDGQSTAIGQFNHPYKTETYDWNFNDYAYHASGAHKMYLRETSSYPSDQYLLSLNTGWHVGAVDNSDTHRATWGRWRYMGLVAPGLTKEAILEALRARRTFSVADRNSALVMRANGQWMGSVISNTTTINFTITAYDPDPTDPLLALVLYDNGVLVTATTPGSNPILYTWTPAIPGSPSHYYYAKAYYDVDGYAFPSYTSPIWTDTSEAPKWNIYLPIIVRDYANR